MEDAAMSAIESFNGPYRPLSNFWFCSGITLPSDGRPYPSVEHAFQAAKTTVDVQRAEIRMAETPGDAKRLGRSVTLRPDWEFIKLGVMLSLTRQKYKNNPGCAALLLATGDAELIEGNNWGDKFWGVCDGEGLNWLGKILMCVRNELKAAND